MRFAISGIINVSVATSSLFQNFSFRKNVLRERVRHPVGGKEL